MTLAQQINALLADKVAAPGDDSILLGALTAEHGPALTATEEAFQRVEILLGAWEEMHRERLALDGVLTRIADSYPWVPYAHGELVDTPEDDAVPTNRRVAREALGRDNNQRRTHGA